MFTHAIVRPPAANFADGLTTVDLGIPNYQRALEQHEAYCQALERCGLRLTRLEPDPAYPDSCFVEDTAIITGVHPDRPHPGRAARPGTPGRASAPVSGARRCVVITRPGAASRAGETSSIRKVLTDFYPDVLSIQSPGKVDGGDVCEAGDHFFIGISERTNEAGARQLAELLAPFSYTGSFVDLRGRDGTQSEPGADRGPRAGSPRGVVVATGSTSKGMLHLKSGLAWLGEKRLVVIDALAERKEFAGYDLVRVSAGEEYAANCVRVNDQVLVAAGYPAFEGRLRELGYQTISLEMSEFQKMDGGLSCLSLRF